MLRSGQDISRFLREQYTTRNTTSLSTSYFLLPTSLSAIGGHSTGTADDFWKESETILSLFTYDHLLWSKQWRNP